PGGGKEKAKIIVDMAKKRRNTRSLSEVGYVFLSLQLGFGGFAPAPPRFATPAVPRWPPTFRTEHAWPKTSGRSWSCPDRGWSRCKRISRKCSRWSGGLPPALLRRRP